MKVLSSTRSVVDYCNDQKRNEVRINREYQRSSGVWPPAARSFLIETILLGFPIPKLFLHQVTDSRTQQSHKEVVDGQQRTAAIRDYFDGRFRLSNTLELERARGKRLSQLDEDLKDNFLEYGLDFDTFVATTPQEVREVFRRMNSFTVPLNPEEHRHAVNQGPFKWFVQRLGSDYETGLLEAGVFTPRQVLRMADSKLFAEVVHACLNGIETTNPKKLDDLYKSRDQDFPEEGDLNHRLRSALDRFVGLPDVIGPRTPLAKPYHAYALLLAMIHVAKPLSSLAAAAPDGKLKFSSDQKIEDNLLTLSQALEDEELDDEGEPTGTYKEFVGAAAEQTNVARQRSTRFKWFCLALTDSLP